MKNELVGVIIDRFGKEVLLIPAKEGDFTVYVDVNASNQFFCRVFASGDGVVIAGPERVRQEMGRDRKKEEIVRYIRDIREAARQPRQCETFSVICDGRVLL